jgi:phage terminase small subunit
MKGALPAKDTAERRSPATGLPGTVLNAPEWLDDDARALFDAAATDLARLGNVVQPSDAISLAQWATASLLAQRGLAELARRTDTDTLDYKRVQASAFKALEAATRLAGDFGLLPAPRTRLGVQHLAGMGLLERLNESRTNQQGDSK